jgi:hypothetical protein
VFACHAGCGEILFVQMIETASCFSFHPITFIPNC